MDDPNPEFVKGLTNELRQFHVGDEAVFWAVRQLIINKVPLTRAEAEKGAK